MRSFAAGPSFTAALRDRTDGAPQEGMTPGGARGLITIGWGRHDRVTCPAKPRAPWSAAPNARVHWFEHSGHFPHWDMPDEAAHLILDTTRRSDDT